MRRVGATSCHGLRLVITPGCAAVQTSLDKVSEFMSLLVWEGLWMDGWMDGWMMDDGRVDGTAVKHINHK